MRPEIEKFLQSVSLFENVKKSFLKIIYDNVREVNIRSHEYLYERGDHSSQIYIIRYGEVMIRLSSVGDNVRYLVSGDIISENSILTGSAHSADALAVLDTMLYSIDGKLFRELAEKDKALTANLNKLMSVRMLDYLDGYPEGINYSRRLIFHIPLENIHSFRSKLREIIRCGTRSYEKKMLLLSVEEFNDMDYDKAMDKISALRRDYPVIHLYFDKPVTESPMNKLVMQSDKIVLWERMSEDLSGTKNEVELYWTNCIRKFDERSIRMIDGGVALDRQSYGGKKKVFIRKETLARHLISKTRGLTLGGGGARALAHIGMLKVLEEEDITIDYISGASFGAVIGALYAMGESVSSIIDTTAKLFGGDDKPFFDPVLPVVSFYKGKKMIKMLRETFGEKRIEDLRIPFVTSAVDLYSGKEVVFETGPIWKALVAAMSLPAVFPPFRHGKYLLVDGGVLNNVPDNLIRSKGADVIISSNVSPLEDSGVTNIVSISEILRSFSLRFLWENIKFPPILKVISRTITLEGRELIRLRRDKMDFFVEFQISHFTIFDFKKYKEIISIGEVQFRPYFKKVKKMFYP
ncbi:MAG: patatin-like phospholipase family protein [Leptospirales bacterium]